MADPLPYLHLTRMTTRLGLYEHALGAQPRPEHGYCVDDAARALVVTSRDPDGGDAAAALGGVYLTMLLHAVTPDGRMHNRRTSHGEWSDTAGTGDHWGRAVWALGVAAARGHGSTAGRRALAGARIAMRARSRWPRSMAYAALGAAALLHAERPCVDDDVRDSAERLLRDARTVLVGSCCTTAWDWPEERLTYANAVIPEAMLVIAANSSNAVGAGAALDLLAWLVRQQLVDGHLSVVPSGGRSLDAVGPGFAQQPIEVAALTEAAWRAFLVTRDKGWIEIVRECRGWFEGRNDLSLPMRDEETGAGYDGLERHGVNLNQGAESTLAWLSTLQLSLLARTPAAR
ncbi:glycosyltransferase [Arthrobacter sp. NEB 688]|uniref:glycosyltransferase n=1 Tax=Arthrobacter sp. NEB 688 TaxID=904039 RepID=UPI001C202DC3|nr:glycosyltransferase [Arthrobacter sp. NEB 688]